MLTIVTYIITSYFIFSYFYGLYILRQEHSQYNHKDDIVGALICHILSPFWVPFSLFDRLKIEEWLIVIFCKIYNMKYEK